MKPSKLGAQALTVLASLLLAACGGGDPEQAASSSTAAALHAPRSFTSVVSFGDSLSDVGTYTPATVIPGTDPPIYLGGKFTTNSATSRIWIENIAGKLGVTVTPAEVGFGPYSTACPAAAQGLASTCTAYGQGGARVTDANGTRHAAGALTVPIKTQIARHLANFQRFKSTDLILLWAGSNDLLWELEQDPTVNPDSFVIRLFQIQAQAQAGVISAEQAQAQVYGALLASQAAMKTAALELSGYIRDEVIAKGGRYVAVLNLPEPTVTPEGAGIAAASPFLGAAMSSFAEAFNTGLQEGLAGQPVQLIDIRSFINDVVAHPAAYEMANTSVPACDATKMATITNGAVTDGFALFCNATRKAPYNGLRDGANVHTWFFADGNHPTTGGHKLISGEVLRQVRSFGWLRGDE
jgi:phospholipase/lecithinase/hemolysin